MTLSNLRNAPGRTGAPTLRPEGFLTSAGKCECSQLSQDTAVGEGRTLAGTVSSPVGVGRGWDVREVMRPTSVPRCVKWNGYYWLLPVLVLGP